VCKQEDQEDWSESFWQYIQANYFAPPPDPHIPLLRWHTKEKQWYLYNAEKGVYDRIEEEWVDDIFQQWGILAEIKPAEKIHAMRLSLKAHLWTDAVWDSGIHHEYTSIENLISGLLDVNTRTLLDHTPEYLSKYQIPRHYRPDIIDMPKELAILYTACKEDWERLQKFMVLAIHGDHTQELFLMCYGVKGAGKSTFLQLIENIYGKDLISKTALQELGMRFGMSDMYDKRFNINPDLSKDPWSTKALSKVKQLTGEDGSIEIEIKGVGKFKWNIRTFLLFGSNQLMGFTKYGVSEMDSIFRRAVLVKFPIRMHRDKEFKKEVIAPELLDRIYSYYIHCAVTLMYEDAGMDAWIEDTKQRWLLDADPVMRVCKEEYWWVPQGSLLTTEVWAHVTERLNADDIAIPADLHADVTQALETMKITRKGRTDPVYMNIEALHTEDNGGPQLSQTAIDKMLAEKKEGSK
jgi:phage/plasmid-associated DNA primase